MSLVGKLHRGDLKPLGGSGAFYRLMTEFNLTQDEAAGRVGKSRSAVANILRLRQLPEPIKASITEGVLSMGHARALLGAETSAKQLEAFRIVVSRGLSVRQTERLIKQFSRKTEPKKTAAKRSDEIYLSRLEDDLSRHFGTRVRIKKRGQKGRVEVEFYNDQDLERLLQVMKQM